MTSKDTQSATHWSSLSFSHASSLLQGILLALLTMQTAAGAIIGKLAKHSHETHDANGALFIASTSVFLVECIKFLLSLIWFLVTPLSSDAPASATAVAARRPSRFAHMAFLREHLSWHTLLLSAVPAAIYAMQNNLSWVAVSRLDPVVYLILNQLKTLFTALLSVLVLGTRLSRVQVLALLNLVMGVILAQMPYAAPDCTKCTAAAAAAARSSAAPPPGSWDLDDLASVLTSPLVIGVGAALLMALFSGIAGVFQESILKSARVLPVPFINLQLGVWSLLATAAIMVYQDGEAVWQHGLFGGYSAITWLAIANSSIGGLLVSAIIRATSNLAKTYAVSFAILLADTSSYFLFDKPINSAFWAAAIVVIISSLLYLERPHPDPATTVADSTHAPTSGAPTTAAASTSASPSSYSSTKPKAD